MLTLQQVIDYLHAHGAPNSVIQQVTYLSRHHLLNSQADFQNALSRVRWTPRGVSWSDMANWVHRGHR
jgi:hypothetical protein